MTQADKATEAQSSWAARGGTDLLYRRIMQVVQCMDLTGGRESEEDGEGERRERARGTWKLPSKWRSTASMVLSGRSCRYIKYILHTYFT